MSDQTNEEPAEAGQRAFPRKGFRMFGLGLQDFIRYFFGGNAGLAIVVLVLICIFLLVEAIWFFPQHHHEFRIYRQAGQEFVDIMKTEVDEHMQLGGNLNVAYLAEVNRTSQAEDQFLNALVQVKTSVGNLTRRSGAKLEDAQDDLEDLLDEIEDEEDAVKKAELEAKVPDARKKAETLAGAWEGEAKVALANSRTWKLELNPIRLTDEQKQSIEEAILMEGVGSDEEPAYVTEVRQRGADLKAASREELADFKATVTELRNAVGPLRDLHRELYERGMENRRVLDKFETAPARRKALLAGAEATEDPEEKARKLEQAEAVVLDTPDYAALNEPIYAAVARHEELAGPFLETVQAAWAKLPERDSLQTEDARERFRVAEGSLEDLEGYVERSLEELPEWRHDKPMSGFKTTMAFFVGKDWVTNSSWHEFYGLLPLFFGSLCISIIALVVAVPFSVAAAVYVNQLARRGEQNFIKPALEFIQAIPSIVLGFFGILVLGTALRELSQVEWLSWVPGFPMSERLTIINAGLLLAFMAVPTIFTLAEDALNNVPVAFSEASFALGASKLQTITKVVMPTAISGIIAAILLGFGRIIGETMVVLLVAGNKIQIPDFTAGIGVVTQPAHTMTGIIAQELGEVDKGSLHWRALFMVGMVLFVISLSINYTAQRVLKRFQQSFG